MSNFIRLTCPSCGGALSITKDIERFACSYCGVEHLVKRSGGIVSLTPIIQRLDKIQNSSDRTVSELAIPRIQQELANANAFLADLKQHKSFNIFVVGIISILGFFIAMGLVFTARHLIIVIVLLFLGTVWVFIPPVVYYFTRSGNRKKQRQCEEYIRYKNQELAKHYQVVQQR